MLLKMSLDQKVNLGRKFKEEFSQLTDEKEIAQFFSDCGGEDDVRAYIRVPQWWDDLTEDWQNKMLNLPFKFVPENLWFKLSQLNLERLQQWYEDITNCSQKNLKKKGRETLSPKIGNQVVSKILPSPKRTKRVLKLHQLVAEGDFQVLLDQKKYNFTPDSLREFKLEVFAGVNGEIFTESLFPYLKARNLNPLDILSTGDRAKFLEKQVKQLIQEKQEQQEEISQLKQQNKEQQNKIEDLEQRDQQKQTEIEQLKQQNQSQQTEIEQLKQQNQDILEQMKEIMKRLPSLQPV